MDIDTFRDQLVVWGVTPSVLLFVGCISLLTLFFSIRIVMKWYLGIQHVQDELRAVRRQLTEIQSMLVKPVIVTEEMNNSLKTDIAIGTDAKTKAKDSSFRLLNH